MTRRPRCADRRGATSASPRSPEQYYSKIYGVQEVGGTAVLYLSAVPFEQIGLRTNVPTEPLPETTWRVLELVPDVVSTGAVLLGGIWWITNRRAEVAKAGGPPQMKLQFPNSPSGAPFSRPSC